MINIEKEFKPPLKQEDERRKITELGPETIPKIESLFGVSNEVLGDGVKEAQRTLSDISQEVLESDLSLPEKERTIYEANQAVENTQRELETRVYEAVKSWWEYVHNTSRCFGCAYCILSSRRDLKDDGGMSGIESFIDREIGEVPSKVSEILSRIPVAINNYFGDPGIQWKDTLSKLENLEKAGHQGPVGIITKSYLSPEKARRLKESKCKVVVLQSISNLPAPIEPLNHQKRIESLGNLSSAGVPTVAYLRPLIPGYNTHEDVLRATLDSIAQSGCRIVCYSGLRGTEDVIELLENKVKEKITPPPGYERWQKDHKLVEERARELIESYAKKLGLLVFRKTSCAVSYAAGLESDYNCHWAQPEKYGCEECIMSEKCAKAATEWEESAENRVRDALHVLGAEGAMEKNPRKQVCQLKEVCHYPCSSCPVSGGTRLKLKGKKSLGELSIARWVAGIPVEAEEIINTPRIFHLTVEPKESPTLRVRTNPEHFYRNPSESACPQGCAYCIVDLNPERQKEYQEEIQYFMNSFVAINLPLRNRERHLEQLYHFDFEKLRGDVVGFGGASEPMLFPKELDFVCQKAREHDFRVAICTKATISLEKALSLYERYGEVLEIEISYAKLSELERTDKTRLETIKNIKQAGFEPLVVIQPFIYSLTNRRLEDLLAEIKSVGVKYVCVNGFRYSSTMEGWAGQVLDSEWLKRYQEHEGEEWLPQREQIEQQIREAGFEVIKIGEWLRRNRPPRETPPPPEEIKNQIRIIEELMKIPDGYLKDWRLERNKIQIVAQKDLNLIKLRAASDSNTECVAKTLSRRLRWPVEIILE
jgi:DNA repair photolyase